MNMPPDEQLDGRMAAALAVRDALQGRRFVGDTLREMRAADRLPAREAALAVQVGQGAVRHLVTIEHVLGALARFHPRQVPPPLRAVLYCAAYQLIWMDRVPAFAAVDQAVALARRLVHGRAAAMTNAVLRRLADALGERRVPWQRGDAAQVRTAWESACQFQRVVLPNIAEAGPHLAAATGERGPRYAELVRRWGAEAAEAVAWASQAVPVTILQRHTLRCSPELFAERLRTEFDPVEFVADTAFVSPASALVDTATFRAGLVFAQDMTAQYAARAVAAQPGERVLDLCAAPGGKSVALALDMHDEGEVVACDTDPQRLARVAANAQRLELNCIRTRLLSPGGPGVARDVPPFDAALADVPCSNTGVIARRPEARLGLSVGKLAALVKLQRELLERAAASVRPAGRLVYSTCSLEPAENEELVSGFVADHPQWRLTEQSTTLPAWGPRAADWHDGGYFAGLRHVPPAS
jgi:16S rRNA (cytosine967-C5)-methyltransferase